MTMAVSEERAGVIECAFVTHRIVRSSQHFVYDRWPMSLRRKTVVQWVVTSARRTLMLKVEAT